MRKLIVLVVFVLVGTIHSNIIAQELYVYSDPASNVPAKSLSLKYGAKWMNEDMFMSKMLMSRHMLDASIGINKKWMIRPAFTFGDMFSHGSFRWESASIYSKFRFYSQDEVHRHFRAAVYVKALYSRNDLEFEEINADGDHSVVQGGFIITQLINKLAISSTLALTEVTNRERWKKYPGPRDYNYTSFNYSISAGYLVLPKKYASYKQTNFNVYLELIGSKGIDRKYYFIDLAPAVQFIFNSNTKLNFGYRFQAKGNAYRMGNTNARANAAPSISFSVERTFFNTFKK